VLRLDDDEVPLDAEPLGPALRRLLVMVLANSVSSAMLVEMHENQLRVGWPAAM
jgi:hypothetical protein